MTDYPGMVMGWIAWSERDRRDNNAFVNFGSPSDLDDEAPRYRGRGLGGGRALDLAQSRCKWWIEGMLSLLKAIDDAPDPVARRPQTPQRRAHGAVSVAVKEGRLVPQPCEVCGTAGRTHAHHRDYSKPLDVHWLCQQHHIAHHTTLGTYSQNGTGPRRLRGAA